ncbi:MAG: glycosyltransferase, partial [Bryobacteraceae bacterium]
MTVTVIIPTLNEESTLAGLLDSLEEVGPDEVVVSDGGSTDGTIEIATGRARVVCGPASRGLQLNSG